MTPLVDSGTILSSHTHIYSWSSARMGARRECDILEHTVQPRPLGAKRLWDVTTENFEWTTMADVECNEFCVVQAESS